MCNIAKDGSVEDNKLTEKSNMQFRVDKHSDTLRACNARFAKADTVILAHSLHPTEATNCHDRLHAAVAFLTT